MRLAKFLATAGVASRRSAEQIVRSGRVTVDGERVFDPARAVRVEQKVMLDGAPVDSEPERVVFAVNKPAGVVSTSSDPQGRPTVVSLVETELRLYPVGRLDIDVTGLILLTNDGDLAHRLMHPSFEVPKTYRARLSNPPVSDAALSRLRSGVVLDDGPTAPAHVDRLTSDTVQITIHEGRKRQVKRMCEHIGHRVRTLERIAFGSLALGDLPPGGYRRLTGGEIAALAAAAPTSDAASGAHRGGKSSS